MFFVDRFSDNQEDSDVTFLNAIQLKGFPIKKTNMNELQKVG